MKKLSWLLFSVALFVTFSLGIQSCRKINEATELGSGLIPAVDNINTFERFVEVETDNSTWFGKTETSANDPMALGAITNDPEFGTTKADIYFQYGPAAYGAGNFLFYNKDSVQGIDSVVLSLGYVSAYGDSIAPLSVRVLEVDRNADFKDSVRYNTQHADFATGTQFGAKSFSIKSLSDTMTLIRKRDTTKVVNVLRIPLSNSFMTNLLDTSHYSTYTAFYNQHRGIAVKADMQGNGLAFFNLLDTTRSKIQVYYRVKRNGLIDTTSAAFYHGLYAGGYSSMYPSSDSAKGRATQANLIRRTPAGNWLTYLNNPSTNEDKVYMQSEPGSAVYLRIPQLDTMANYVVHRAELIASIVPSAQDNIFTPPSALYLGRRSGDSMLQVRDDSLSALLTSNGAVNGAVFGGELKYDKRYRFNLTLHVQQILTHQAPNDQLKLFAPYKISVADQRLGFYGRTLFSAPRIADGRAVLGGGTYSDPNLRMRLRIVYSKLP